jgi:hypothetical protein
MSIEPFPRVVNVERIGDGDLILELDNGSSAIYPASLLASMLSEAIKLEQTETDSGETQRVRPPAKH